jgi:hypothetical protein
VKKIIKYMIMKNTIYLILALIFCFKSLTAQVTTTPFFPAEKDTVRITFDASSGNGALANTDTIIYAHTGVLTNLSSSIQDWKYTKFAWTTNDPSLRLKYLGNNKFLLVFPSSIRSFYNVPSSENILNFAFVFRNANGSIVGKTVDNKNILVPIYDQNIHCKIVSPTINASAPFLDSSKAVLAVVARASKKCTITLFLNNQVVKSVSGDSLSNTVGNFKPGTNWIKVTVNDGVSISGDSVFVINTPQPQKVALPSDAVDGITYLNDSTVLFNIYAPGKKNAYVLGDFNNWTIKDAFFMNMTPDSTRFWLRVSGLTPQKEYGYQYLFDKNIKVADPYSEKILDPGNDKFISSTVYPDLKPYPDQATGIVSILQTAQKAYIWPSSAFSKPAKTDLVIYELHMRDFLGSHNYVTLKDTLNYLKKLGINAIELMPINEFEGNNSWGYNPDFYFAPDKYYGSKTALKDFISKAHSMGIAVIIDIALNHSFGQSPLAQMYWDQVNNIPAKDNPWFNALPTHPFNVGNDFNHESPATKNLVRNVISFWIKEYKIDGYRFDLSKGFTQKKTTTAAEFSALDTSRVNIWKGIADYLWRIDPSTYVILEHLGDNSEETILANYGIMLWGNLNFAYGQASMGYTANNTSDLGWAFYKNRGWKNPNAVVYMESHDEERMLFRNLTYGNSDIASNYKVKDFATAHARAALSAVFFLSIPGPKMIWEFGELGYDISINGAGGRTNAKPILWDYFHILEKRMLFNVYSAMIKLKIQQPAFKTRNPILNIYGAYKYITLLDTSLNVSIVGNFDVRKGTLYPKFPNTGLWYDYFTGDSINVTDVAMGISYAAGEYHVYTSKRLSKPDLSLGMPVTFEPSDAWQLTTYPNPATSHSIILVDIKASENVLIKIFNVVGEEIKVFSTEKYAPGKYEINWDLKSNQGTAVPNGMYFINVLSGKESRQTKIIVNQ